MMPALAGTISAKISWHGRHGTRNLFGVIRTGANFYRMSSILFEKGSDGDRLIQIAGLDLNTARTGCQTFRDDDLLRQYAYRLKVSCREAGFVAVMIERGDAVAHRTSGTTRHRDRFAASVEVGAIVVRCRPAADRIYRVADGVLNLVPGARIA